jgi:glycosyltransferase involved in cell wall biosynthesis
MHRSSYKLLNLVDGGSLAALAAKGNLCHAESLYNPGGFFAEVHCVTTDPRDLEVPLRDTSLVVHYVNRHSVRRRYGGPLVNWWLYARRLADLVRQYDIDLIRARGPYFAGFFGALVGKRTERPVVLSLGGDHRACQQLLGSYPVMGSRFLSERMEEYSVRNADGIFCINEFTRKYVLRLGARRERTHYVPLRIDVSRFHPDRDGTAVRRELGLTDEPVVLFNGRLEADKQVDVVLEAIPAILREHPRTRFVFLGDGSLRPRLIDRAAELGITHRIYFAGFVAADRVADFMAAATAVWIPMSGFVIYEAAASGKPIVAFDVDWHSDFIADGETGVLVPDRDVPGVARAVSRVLGDPLLAARLGRNARAKINTDFDPQRLVQREIDEYRRVLAAHGRGGSRMVLPEAA